MIDLHMHSSYSDDGEYTPSELIKMCADERLKRVSITDHNCVKANAEAQVSADRFGIAYIPGIEIDCVYQGVTFHVLGYGIDYGSKDFEEIEERIRAQSLGASLRRLELTKQLGFPVTEKELREATKDSYWNELWMGEVFAQILLAKPELENHPLLKPYRAGGERDTNPYVNFQWDFYSQGKPCYAAVEYPSMEDIISIIHQNRGIAVLAHPGANLKGQEHLLEGILEIGMDGLEAFSSYHSQKISDLYFRKAKEKGVIYTCGSDFHGKNKPAIPLGGAVFGTDMDKEEQARLIENMLFSFKK